MKCSQPNNYFYGLAKDESYRIIKENPDKYWKKWERNNPNRKIVNISRNELILGYALIGMGLVDTIHFILYKELKSTYENNYMADNRILFPKNNSIEPLSPVMEYNSSNEYKTIGGCKYCGSKLIPGASFCNMCGTKLN